MEMLHWLVWVNNSGFRHIGESYIRIKCFAAKAEGMAEASEHTEETVCGAEHYGAVACGRFASSGI